MDAATEVPTAADEAMRQLESLEQERARMDARFAEIEKGHAALGARSEELEEKIAEVEQEHFKLEDAYNEVQGRRDALEEERRALVEARDQVDQQFTALFAALDSYAEEGAGGNQLSELLEDVKSEGVPQVEAASLTVPLDVSADQSFTPPVIAVTPSVDPAANGAAPPRPTAAAVGAAVPWYRNLPLLGAVGAGVVFLFAMIAIAAFSGEDEEESGVEAMPLVGASLVGASDQLRSTAIVPAKPKKRVKRKKRNRKKSSKKKSKKKSSKKKKSKKKKK